MHLLDLLEKAPSIRDRILGHHESIIVKNKDGSIERVDIKIIQGLKDIADDPKYLTDAVRRIRDLEHNPVDSYRIFFAPRKSNSAHFIIQILGVFLRDVAYTPETLKELTRRYESTT